VEENVKRVLAAHLEIFGEGRRRKSKASEKEKARFEKSEEVSERWKLRRTHFFSSPVERRRLERDLHRPLSLFLSLAFPSLLSLRIRSSFAQKERERAEPDTLCSLCSLRGE
jgi:hypothetical protein